MCVYKFNRPVVLGVVWCAPMLVLSFLGVGCSKAASPGRSVAVGARPVVVSPISSQVSEPGRLLGVNKLYIERPTIQAPRRGQLSEDSLLATIRIVAEQTLSMKIAPAKVAKPPKEEGGAVLRTTVLSLDPLHGSRMGGEPARVSFTMGVYTEGVTAPVWFTTYTYQQEAFSDNWLKVGERLGPSGTGAGWSSEGELFKVGVQRALEDFNSRRDEQFQAGRGNSR